MANTYIKINIHLVFHTKSRGIPMRKEDLPLIFEYIGGIIKKVNGIPFMIGGVENHIHVLATLPKTMTLPDFVRTIKANSSRWIKQIDAYYAQFCWQDGYGAFSVSPSLLNIAINYIRNQEEHHKKQTFQEEYRSILTAQGIPYDEKDGDGE